MGRRLSAAVLIAAAFAVFSCFIAVGNGVPVWAQIKICPGQPVCPSGDTYTGSSIVGGIPYGTCNEPPTGANYRDHVLVPCPDGWTLETSSGTCRPRTCGGSGAGVCQEQPVCPSGDTYTGSSIVAGVPRGACDEPPSGLNYRDHVLVPCPDGWTLDTSRGVCRRCPNFVYGGPRPHPKPMPALADLTIRRAWLQTPTTKGQVNSVPLGRPYFACFIVANIGAAASGPFRVAGGGLGVPTRPYLDMASLTPGASRQGCLSYATTPDPGSYQLVITADSQNVVRETNKANNEATIQVVVTR
jgi:hypothetical protein